MIGTAICNDLADLLTAADENVLRTPCDRASTISLTR
jgi:hypothetical protein